MNCPKNVADALLAIVGIGILKIRAAANRGDATRCVVEADHIHNIPDVLSDYHPELLDFYWHTERMVYIRHSTSEDVAQFVAPWAVLQECIG